MQCWKTALDWLEDCNNNHPECKVSQKPAFYPTRLVDIGDSNSSDFRVIESATEYPVGGYVTLSHRWGEETPIKLTEHSCKELINGTSLQKLPLTFQHAIEIAKRLNKRYIWIDSLCIFQDENDQSDWIKEAALMYQVYSGSFLNISAAAGRNGSYGLFETRDPQSELRPFRMLCRVPPVTKGVLSPVKEFILTEAYTFFDRELSEAPLNQRAWVYQERLLAPRVLHFGPTQLFWECRGSLFCERFPKQLPEFTNKYSAMYFKSLDITRRAPSKPHMNQVSIQKNLDRFKYHLWYDMVLKYSKCQLTFGKDKALAISGVAKMMRDILDDEYIAGLWRRNLEAQLLWQVQLARQADKSPSKRPMPYRAPTWSWLSIDGVIIPDRYNRGNMHIEVLDVQMSYHSNDTTGLINGGSLKLRGRLRPLQINRSPLLAIDEDSPFAWSRGWILTVSGKDLISADPLKATPKNPVTSLDVQQIDFDESNTKKELFIMSAGGPWNTADDPFTYRDQISNHNMLLLKCVKRTAAVFHRLGVASINVDEQPENWKTVQQYDEDEADIPCVEYDAEKHLHTIILQ
jgi:hypothetical protein